jgi:hypothetical protein
MEQGQVDTMRSSVYTERKGFEAPFVAGLSKDRTELIVRVATQESLLPDDREARKHELFGVAKRCELYFGGYSPAADLANHTRVEFLRNDAATIARDQDISDEEFFKKMTLAVYQKGELTMP